jgi:ketosteroid isomerase-like protein
MPQVVSPSDLVRDVFAALDAKDPAALTALMSDDVRMRLGNADAVEGRAAFLGAVSAFIGSVAGVRHAITSVWSVDDVVIAEMAVHYERLDGGKVTLPCCNVFRVRDGLVSDYRVYIDINPVYA